MSCAASAKVFLNRFLSILIVMVLISTCMFAQNDAKTSQAKPDNKKTSTGKSKKQSGAANQEKKTESESTNAEKTPGASDGDQEEAKGPWHGLTWRLIGPFRGGRVLAVSGVVGDEHTYYFG
ncbi:MAG TPA: hypothetical protein VGK21_01440, partial [Candidatus Angelobacter sp.]